VAKGVSIWVQSIFQDTICWYLYLASSFSHSSKPASVLFFFSSHIVFTFTFYLENCIGNRTRGFNLSPINLPRRPLLVFLLRFSLSWNFTFTFYSERSLKGGLNLAPVNLPRRHLLISVLCLLLLPLEQAGLCT